MGVGVRREREEEKEYMSVIMICYLELVHVDPGNMSTNFGTD